MLCNSEPVIVLFVRLMVKFIWEVKGQGWQGNSEEQKGNEAFPDSKKGASFNSQDSGAMRKANWVGSPNTSLQFCYIKIKPRNFYSTEDTIYELSVGTLWE